MFRHLLTTFCVASVVLFTSANVLADGLKRTPPTARSSGISPVALAGYTDGIAAGLQLDLGDFALRGTGAYMPLLFSLSDSSTNEFERFEFLHSGQANVDAMILPWSIGKRNRLGLSLGYRFNTVLEHGFALGGQVEGQLSDSLTLLVMANFALYPDGEDGARDELGNPEGIDFNFPLGGGVSSGLGVGLKF